MAGGWTLASKPTPKLRNVLLLVGGLLLGGLLGLLIIFGDSLAGAFKASPAPPKIGEPLHSFSLKSLDGKRVTLEDYAGTPLVINFWATWCKPCENEMPLLNSVAMNAENQFQVIGINVEEDGTAVTGYIEDNKVDFRILLDEKGEIADQYLINGYPTTFFVDGDGILRAVRIGELDEEMLKGFLEQIGVEL